MFCVNICTHVMKFHDIIIYTDCERFAVLLVFVWQNI